MPEIAMQGVTKVYPYPKGRMARRAFGKAPPSADRERGLEGVTAVKGCELTVNSGEFCVLLGPSGCGKSTILRMIAGLEDITDGALYLDGGLANDTPAHRRNVAMVFQNYSLYPHLTVAENIAFPLKNQRLPREDIAAAVTEICGLLGLEELTGRKPGELSGGEKQRVAIGRALVRRPAYFLLDEPFSNLDETLRAQMRGLLVRLHRKLGSTFVYVTHDQMEAMTLADRLVVLDDGVIQQAGTPREIYNHPANLFVASFVGAPSMNLMDATLLWEKGGWQLELPGIRHPLPERQGAALRAAGPGPRKAVAGIRPVHLKLCEQGWEAEVMACEPLGPECVVLCRAAGLELTAVLPADSLGDGMLHRGQAVRLLPDLDKLHLFDPATGVNLC